MVKKLDALERIKKSGCADFKMAFAWVAGYVAADAQNDPNASYASTEVRDLLDYLFELQKKDPAAATAEVQ